MGVLSEFKRRWASCGPEHLLLDLEICLAGECDGYNNWSLKLSSGKVP